MKKIIIPIMCLFVLSIGLRNYYDMPFDFTYLKELILSVKFNYEPFLNWIYNIKEVFRGGVDSITEIMDILKLFTVDMIGVFFSVLESIVNVLTNYLNLILYIFGIPYEFS